MIEALVIKASLEQTVLKIMCAIEKQPSQISRRLPTIKLATEAVSDAFQPLAALSAPSRASEERQ